MCSSSSSGGCCGGGGRLSRGRAVKQADEVRALAVACEERTPLYELTVRTPRVLARIEDAVAANARAGVPLGRPLTLTVTIGANDNVGGHSIDISFELPLGYPDTEPPNISIELSPATPPPSALVEFNLALASFCAAFVASGTPCLCDALAFIEENLVSFSPGTAAAAGADDDGDGGGGGGCKKSFLVFNHLLKGKEHKKEKAMVDCAKSAGLVGRVVYGTPGVVVLDGSEQGEVAEYLADARKIGKRGELTLVMDVDNGRNDGAAATPRGLAETTLQALQEELQDVSLFRQAIGLA